MKRLRQKRSKLKRKDAEQEKVVGKYKEEKEEKSPIVVEKSVFPAEVDQVSVNVNSGVSGRNIVESGDEEGVGNGDGDVDCAAGAEKDEDGNAAGDAASAAIMSAVNIQEMKRKLELEKENAYTLRQKYENVKLTEISLCGRAGGSQSNTEKTAQDVSQMYLRKLHAEGKELKDAVQEHKKMFGVYSGEAEGDGTCCDTSSNRKG